MCYLCLKDNPFEQIELEVKKFRRKKLKDLNSFSSAEFRIRASALKGVLMSIENTNERLCDIGYATVERLKEEQYRVSRQL